MTRKLVGIGLLLALAASVRPGQAQDFALRLGTACEGSNTPKCGAALGLVLGGGDTRSVSTVTTRYLPDGRFAQTFSTGAERTLFTTKRASLFASGQAGVELTSGGSSGLGHGALGLLIPVYKRDDYQFSIVPIGSAGNAPAEGGSWNGGFSVSIQVDFRE